MKNILFAVAAAACAFAAGAKTSTPEGWTDDYDAALKAAAEEHKYVLADFTGSDWCGWCKKLDAEIFSKPAFKTVAPKKFVLLYVDSPRDKALLSKACAERNPKLVEKYGVRGFPTILILDAKGEKVAQLGYAQGGPEKYLASLDEAVKYAPLVEKFIAPLEKLFDGADAQAAFRKLQDEAEKKLAALDGKDEKARKKAERKIQRETMRTMCAEILPGCLAKLEKALAEAEKAEVPKEVAEKKEALVAKYKAALATMKKMVEAYDMQKKVRDAKKKTK